MLLFMRLKTCKFKLIKFKHNNYNKIIKKKLVTWWLNILLCLSVLKHLRFIKDSLYHILSYLSNRWVD